VALVSDGAESGPTADDGAAGSAAGDDDEFGIRIEAAGADDDLADFDADGDGDERDAAGHDAAGLVAAPPSRDD